MSMDFNVEGMAGTTAHLSSDSCSNPPESVAPGPVAVPARATLSSQRRSLDDATTGRQQHSSLSLPNRKSSRNRPLSLSPFRPRKDNADRWRAGGGRSVDDGAKSPVRSENVIHQSAAMSSPVDSNPGANPFNNWRKKYPRRFSSVTLMTTPPPPPSLCDKSPDTEAASPAPKFSASRVLPSRSGSRRSTPSTSFSLPQFVRRSLQPLISSSPSIESDDSPQLESVTKMRYMKCKQVVLNAFS